MLQAFKALNKDLTCRGYQFKLGEWNEEVDDGHGANCVQNGLHCATNPLDCLSYYPIWEDSRYFMCLCDGDIHEDGSDTKVSCIRMKLVKELDAELFVAYAIKYMVEHPYEPSSHHVEKNNPEKTNSDYPFIIVRNKDPKGMGKLGDVVGLLQEEKDSPAINRVAIIKIDGKTYLPGEIYSISDAD